MDVLYLLVRRLPHGAEGPDMQKPAEQTSKNNYSEFIKILAQ